MRQNLIPIRYALKLIPPSFPNWAMTPSSVKTSFWFMIWLALTRYSGCPPLLSLWYLSANGGNRGYKSEPLVALTNVNGCIDADTVNISVRKPSKRNENLTICSGDSVLFSPDHLSEPGSYEYRTGFCDSLVTSISPSCPGFYHAAPPNHLRGRFSLLPGQSGGKRRSILRSNSKPIRLR